MPIINKQGEVTTVTIEPREEQRLRQFEQDMIKSNAPVEQHTASSMMIDEKQKPVSPITLYRLIKRISGNTSEEPPAIEFHSASAVEKNVTNNNKQDNNTNLVLRNLMKKICTMASPISL
jgi:hypothetical protein